MKSKILISAFAATLLAALPAWLRAQTQYNVVTLPALGGTAGAANSINNRGWATGLANFAGDKVGHASLWIDSSSAIDLGALGGPTTNSAVAWPVKSDNGLIVGISDTAEDNKLGEAFSCWPFFTPASPTRKVCNGFRWTNNVMTLLPPFPDGYNSYATAANNRGEIVGWAENGVHDPSCVAPFQVLQFRAVIWEPNGGMRELPPLTGDSTSAATAINDRGQVVGISGACGIAVGGVSAAHAVLWDNGVPTEIPNLGGHSWNTPTAINNQGTVVGFSLLAGQDGTRNYEAFVWTRSTGTRSLGKPAGDIRSGAFGINDKGLIVGVSRGGPNGTRALLWQDGKMIDLNTLTAPGSPYLLYANDINDMGAIAGGAYIPSTRESPAYVAVPGHDETTASSSATKENSVQVVPASRHQEFERRAFKRLGIDPSGKD